MVRIHSGGARAPLSSSGRTPASGEGPVRYWSRLLTDQGVTPQQVRFLFSPQTGAVADSLLRLEMSC